MSVSLKTMATDQARAGSGGLLGLGLIGATPAISGKGIGVAVIDSGIATHSALSGKVVASVNFATGETSTTDGFGHGTHIAGIIAGVSNYGPTPLFKTGVAPGAHLVNVRVLNREGVGYTSDVIAGIQWVMANKTQYAIRVINLSLGHPIVEPCFFDPLCLAAEDAVNVGPGGRRLRRQQRQGCRGPDGARQHLHSGQRAQCDHGRRAQHVEHDVAERRHRHDLQLPRSDAIRHAAEAGRRGAGQQDRVA